MQAHTPSSPSTPPLSSPSPPPPPQSPNCSHLYNHPHQNNNSRGGRPQQQQQQRTYRNVHVRGLPPAWCDEDLLAAFDPFGPTAATVMRDGRSGDSKGFGFVTFGSEEAGRRACEAVMAHHTGATSSHGSGGADRTLGGGSIPVPSALIAAPSRHAGPPATDQHAGRCASLYIRNIPLSAPEAAVRAVLASFGAISRAVVTPDRSGGPQVWLVFVSYVRLESAAACAQALHNTYHPQFPGAVLPIVVKYDQHHGRRPVAPAGGGGGVQPPEAVACTDPFAGRSLPPSPAAAAHFEYDLPLGPTIRLPTPIAVHDASPDASGDWSAVSLSLLTDQPQRSSAYPHVISNAAGAGAGALFHRVWRSANRPLQHPPSNSGGMHHRRPDRDAMITGSRHDTPQSSPLEHALPQHAVPFDHLHLHHMRTNTYTPTHTMPTIHADPTATASALLQPQHRTPHSHDDDLAASSVLCDPRGQPSPPTPVAEESDDSIGGVCGPPRGGKDWHPRREQPLQHNHHHTRFVGITAAGKHTASATHAMRFNTPQQHAATPQPQPLTTSPSSGPLPARPRTSSGKDWYRGSPYSPAGFELLPAPARPNFLADALPPPPPPSTSTPTLPSTTAAADVDEYRPTIVRRTHNRNEDYY